MGVINGRPAVQEWRCKVCGYLYKSLIRLYDPPICEHKINNPNSGHKRCPMTLIRETAQ